MAQLNTCYVGASTAILGKETAMTCTVAVEDVIEQHYNRYNRLQYYSFKPEYSAMAQGKFVYYYESLYSYITATV